MMRRMDLKTTFHELSEFMTYREIAAQVGLVSGSQAHKIAHGKQASVSYEVGVAAVSLLRRCQAKQARRDARKSKVQA